MIGFAIAMITLAVVGFTCGALIYKGHDKFIKRGYFKRAGKKKLKYIAQTIMLLSICPLLSAIVAMISPDKEAILLASSTFIVSSIICFIVADRYIKNRK